MASRARSCNSYVPRLAASQGFKQRQVEFISSNRNLYSAWAARLAFTVRPSHAFGRKERVGLRRHAIECSAAGAWAVGGEPSDELSPYQVLGVSPLDKFDNIKAVYTRRRKDAERQGDEAAMARFERAYDKIMMTQLSNRKQGLTFGSFEVSKEIKYADKQALFPWCPRLEDSLDAEGEGGWSPGVDKSPTYGPIEFASCDFSHVGNCAGLGKKPVLYQKPVLRVFPGQMIVQAFQFHAPDVPQQPFSWECGFYVMSFIQVFYEWVKVRANVSNTAKPERGTPFTKDWFTFKFALGQRMQCAQYIMRGLDNVEKLLS